MSDETCLQQIESRLDLLEEKQKYLWSSYRLFIRSVAKMRDAIEFEEAEDESGGKEGEGR